MMRKLHYLLLFLFVFPTGGFAETTVTGVRIGSHPDKTRIVLDIDHRVTYKAFILSDPYRVVVDLPEVGWRVAKKRRRLTGAVSAFRYGLFENGTSRLVFDVRRPVKIARAFLIPPRKTQSYRLVLDLVAVSRADFMATREAAKRAQKEETKRAQKKTPPQLAARRPIPLPTPKPKRLPASKPVIVIDPGHGGIDPGAIGSKGTWEKHVALSYGRDLRKALNATGRYKAVLTRNRDIFLPLRRRIAIARAKRADLFLSLHADSIGNRRVRGAHVYTLSETASDKEAASLAAKENKSDLIAGVDLSDQSNDVTNILIDLAQRETMNQSAIFARMVIGELRKTTRVIRKSHRFAGFAVLKAPDVPSVLVELGYLSNKAEEAKLRKKSHRRNVARAIVRSVDRYFAQQQAFRQP